MKTFMERLRKGFRRRGIDVLTVQEDGMSSEPDTVIIERATQLGRVAFTSDDDFLAEAAERQASGVHFSGVIYAYQLGVTIRQCIDDLELFGVATDPPEHADQDLYLPLK